MQAYFVSRSASLFSSLSLSFFFPSSPHVTLFLMFLHVCECVTICLLSAHVRCCVVTFACVWVCLCVHMHVCTSECVCKCTHRPWIHTELFFPTRNWSKVSWVLILLLPSCLLSQIILWYLLVPGTTVNAGLVTMKHRIYLNLVLFGGRQRNSGFWRTSHGTRVSSDRWNKNTIPGKARHLLASFFKRK